MQASSRPHGTPRQRWENAPIAAWLDKRILFVTGKGGVGRTTVSLALGMAAAAAGKRTIVCEVAAQERTSRIFERSAIGFEETELQPNLSAISIDPDHSTREYLELQLPVRAMGDLLYRSRIFNYLAAATPGLSEMVTIGKIWELSLPKRRARGGQPYDLVIVDSPATGHGLGLLQTPSTFAEIARVGPMARQATTIQKTITNHKRTGVVIVALPEEMPVNESASLERELIDTVGLEVDRIYMNALYPERFGATELERIEAAATDAREGIDADPVEAAALAAATDQARRAAAQRQQLDRLREMTSSPVSELPFIYAPEIGREQIAELSGHLDGSPEGVAS